MASDLRQPFHDELVQLGDELTSIAQHIPADLRTATKAIVHADDAATADIAVRDGGIDTRSTALERAARSLVALQQPVGGDLRLVLAVLRLATVVERSARLTAHIAELAQRIDGDSLPPQVARALEHVAEQTAANYETAIEAWHNRDDERARRVHSLDDEVDAGVERLFDAMQKDFSGSANDIRLIIDLGVTGRHLERLGDHAVTFADQTLYLVAGVEPPPA